MLWQKVYMGKETPKLSSVEIELELRWDKPIPLFKILIGIQDPVESPS
jgi:hypothetical protein